MEKEIEFIPVKKEELDKFTKDMADSFAVATQVYNLPEDKIPPRQSVFDSFDDPHAEIFHILANKKKVGGAILLIDNETNHNKLDLFFLYAGNDNKGLGTLVWRAIELKYPNTKVWELYTPYFEKRNINFYVNKCGFHIVEFFNDHHKEPDHKDSHRQEPEEHPVKFDYFKFQKIMK